MPKRIEFTSRHGVVEALRKRAPQCAKWFQPKPASVGDIVMEPVGGNTFRAFQRLREQPSQVFRSWAGAVLDDERFLTSSDVESQEAFDAWHNRFCDRLVRFWQWRMNAAIPFGASRKLPNLLLKHYARSSETLAEAMREQLISRLHIPWDSYSLVALRNCGEHGLTIPRTASMGFVQEAATYQALQRAAQVLGGDAAVPPIYLDVLVWHRTH